MTEYMWLVGTDQQAMLDYLDCRASDRKLRLLACACCRRMDLADERLANIVQVCELYADGKATWNQLATARKSTGVLLEEARQGRGQGGCGTGAVLCVQATAHPEARLAAERACRIDKPGLVRDLFGNPFRPLTVDPSWFTPVVLTLAQAVYDERILPSGELDPVRLAVLADALEEAGASGAILEHLRGPGPHVRGCHAVDALLGKE